MIIATLGWIGVSLTLGSYLLVVRKLLNVESRGYLVANIIGGSFVAYSCFVSASYPSMVANAAWAVVGVAGLFGPRL